MIYNYNLLERSLMNFLYHKDRCIILADPKISDAIILTTFAWWLRCSQDRVHQFIFYSVHDCFAHGFFFIISWKDSSFPIITSTSTFPSTKLRKLRILLTLCTRNELDLLSCSSFRFLMKLILHIIATSFFLPRLLS